MSSTIIYYSQVYSGYHNEIFWKYEDRLMNVSYKIDLESTIAIKKITEKTENGYLKIKGYYNKEIGEEEIDFEPFRIVVDEYDKNNKFLNSLYIEPDMNNTGEEGTMGTTFWTDYLYFSAITYFTIGYGDVYPTASFVKEFVIQEALISHLLSIIFVPILIILGQAFITKKDKTSINS